MLLVWWDYCLVGLVGAGNDHKKESNLDYVIKNTSNENLSLKRFLLKHQISQRTLSRIRRREILLMMNGQLVDLKAKAVSNAEVKLIFPPENNSKLVADFAPIEVLYEDSNWLIVNKPAGLASVPGPTNQTTTLVNRIKGYMIKQNMIDRIPHIITRLDRFTSGLVLVAKHHLAQSMIETQVEEHAMDKRYLAIVNGLVEPISGLIDLPIKRVVGQPQRIIAANGQSAQTEYWVRQANQAASLVEAKLYTGRNHQIRLHFSALGYPLLGDQLYGGNTTLITRQALHAWRLRFLDPFSKQQLEATAPLPLDLQQLLSSLKLSFAQL